MVTGRTGFSGAEAEGRAAGGESQRGRVRASAPVDLLPFIFVLLCSLSTSEIQHIKIYGMGGVLVPAVSPRQAGFNKFNGILSAAVWILLRCSIFE